VSGPSTVLVTGAGRGIGRATAEAFLDAGWRVVAGVRDVPGAREAYAERPELAIVRLDVTESASVVEGVAAAHEHAGGALGCVVSNAGYAVLGAVEDVDLGEVRAMFETNLFGAAAVLQQALPPMREAGGGVVVFMSSIGARISNPLLGMYHASKYGLSAMAEALAVEGAAFGIRVVSLEPGMVDTDFPKATRLTGAAGRGEGPYAALGAELRAGFGRWRRDHPTTGEEVAAAVVAATLDPACPFRVPVGDDARLLTALRESTTDERVWRHELLGFLEIHWLEKP
jgi:NAD(P)-dependent dehydrogenase (short-subunit alcohol dehydrogenase family)